MKVWLNREILPIDEAKISVLDHGFLYGHGLFETLRAEKGKIYLLKEHMQRLRSSAKLLKIAFEMSDREIESAILALLEENQLTNAYVRLTLSKGKGPMGLKGTFEHPTLLIFCKELQLPSNEEYRNGRDLCIIELKRSTPESGTRVKSLNYLNSLMGFWEVSEKKCSEGIMLTPEGYITEGTVSNLFFVEKDNQGKDRLLTPSEETGILIGVTRQEVIRIAKKLNIPVLEAKFKLERLGQAQEAFTTNAIAEIVPIRTIEQYEFLSPGPTTQRLMENYIHENH